ncbi:hypothetical protein [Pendulispora albinea]|uniref:Carboxypeptidase regulatory-like domain-containing protein n=1 Tax=Pendulispora albinea TaxID=2741071 RepID=A0ABZ2MBE2_9BACT
MQKTADVASLAWRSLILTGLCLSMAGMGCASSQEATASALSSTMGPTAPQRSGPSSASRFGQPDEDEARKIAARPPRNVCLRGVVSSAGPFGRPLERVRVHAALEGEGDVETRTDGGGAFHLCIDRASQTIGKGVILSRYVDRQVRTHIAFERTGFAAKEMDVTLDTADGEGKLDVFLESASTARAP